MFHVLCDLMCLSCESFDNVFFFFSRKRRQTGFLPFLVARKCLKEKALGLHFWAIFDDIFSVERSKPGGGGTAVDPLMTVLYNNLPLPRKREV